MLDKELHSRVDKDYRRLLETAGERGLDASEQLEGLNRRMLEKNFTMQGKPFPTFLRPLFVDKRFKEPLLRICGHVMSAVEKVTNLFFDDPEYQPFFEMDPLDRELAMIDPRYPRRVIQARLDAFLYENGSIKFLEFNCDSPSGMGWHDQLIRFFEELPVMKDLNERYEAALEPLLPPFFRMLQAKNRQFGNPDDTVFAIVCKRYSTIRYDVDLIIDHINEKEGHKAVFADPRDFTYDGKTLRVGDTPVGLVYRDAIQDFTDYLDEVQPVLNAFRDGKVCFINPFASRVGGLKCVLWFMTDERTRHLFTDEELKVISETIPWTRFMRDERTNYVDREVDLLEFVRSNKELFVLKPNAGYGGFGVTIGREVDQKHWEKVVEGTRKEKWVVQDFVEIPRETFPVFDPDLSWKPKNVNINFFAFDNRLGGGFTRISDGSVINIHQGGGLIPICYIGEKQRPGKND